MVDENQTKGIIAYEKETGKQAMVDGELTDDFKAWALKHSEKLKNVSGKDQNTAGQVSGVVEETKEEPKEEEEEKVLEPKKDDENTGVYVVENSRNQFVREYTPEIHGDNRKKLAEQFAKKIKGKVIIR